jgi:kumamolisin
MSRTRYLFSALAVPAALAVALSACGGGGSPGATNHGMPPVVPTAPLQPASAGKFAWGSSALKNATYQGPANFAAMAVNVAVQMQNAPGLVQYAASVSDPHSPDYRHFLTPQEIGARFGATTSDYQATAKYFAQYGLHVGGWPQHLSLFVSGTQSQLQTAFHTTFGVYRSATGAAFIAPVSAPSFNTSLPVTMVGDLVSLPQATRSLITPRVGNNSVDGYTPTQIRAAFDYSGAYNEGYTGAGINIGIIGTGPISAGDVPLYASRFHVQAASVTQVDATDSGVAAGLALNSPTPNPSGTPPTGFPYSTGLSTPPPATARCSGTLPTCNPEDVEAQIDTEQAATLAPGSNILFYLAYNAGECYEAGPGLPAGSPCPGGGNAAPALGLQLSDDEIQQAIADDQADILSLSYGGPEIANPSVGEYGAAYYYFDPANPTAGFGPAEFAALAAEGIAVFVASGDVGAEICKLGNGIEPYYDDPCVSYPASDPSVVAVGGVTAPMDQFGNLINQITGWGVQTSGGTSGSTGGVSAYFPILSYQNGIPGSVGATRNIPDISLDGDPATGISVLIDAPPLGPGLMGDEGGTSVAAPQAAAMWALVLQACRQSATCSAKGSGPHPYRLGNPNPLFYAQYYANGAAQPQYATTFYDVVYGNNAIEAGPPPYFPGRPLDPGYNAGVGYDLVTGLGVPFGAHLIDAILKAEN